MNVIEINNLSKRYGKVQALDSVSLSVARGELFGLIGPDGAGKTTLFRLLTTLIRPDDGTASVEGLDIVRDYRAIRERVGYMPGRFSLYLDLTVEENLNFFAALFGTRVEESYDLVAPIYRQIEPFKTRRAGKLSGGMKQKLALSCALIHRPSVLFLDEPTTGVDAVSRSEFWDMLSELKTKGITILVSTPYMDEAQRCDRIALCNEGRIMRIDTPQNIVDGFGGELYAVAADNILRRVDAHNAPLVAECDAVATLRLVHIRGRYEDGYPFGFQFRKHIPELAARNGVHTRCRLVQKQNRRTVNQCARQREFLFHTARQFSRTARFERLYLPINRSHKVVRLLDPRTEQSRKEIQILLDRQIGIEREPPGHIAHPLADSAIVAHDI